MIELEKILKKYWGYDNFRTQQKEIIESILTGIDTLAILPTGSGKSICFQLPALITKGVCLVISPLIALMKDQVEQLNKKNIPAAAIYGGMKNEEIREIQRKVLDEEIKLLYISPERLQSERFLRMLTNVRISFIAIDEVHCISQWGHDFRPAYLKIKDIKHHLPAQPILSLTATATPKVEEEIIEKLSLRNAIVFKGRFARPELSLSAEFAENKETKLVTILQNENRSSIVYCRSRRSCKELSLLLNQQNISTTFYHAGLSKDERNTAQESWLTNKQKVIVATNAFGMGINKSDVGLVIHYDLPESLESYYQEVGRAGRDGKQSKAILLYNQRSLERQMEMANLKYPSESALRILYNDVCNHLAIPMGGGAENYYEFDFIYFVKKFSYNMLTASHGMQLLSKQNLWHLTDAIFVPTRVQILASREELNHLANHYHRQDALLKQMLRLYNGIWQHAVPINEFDIASQIKIPVAQINEDLQFLAARSYIKLFAKKDKPQLYFTDNRYPAEQIILRYDEIKWYQKRDEERLHAMQEFVLTKENCRMKLIAKYFGQEEEKCGNCDNCNPQTGIINIENIRSEISTIMDRNQQLPLEDLLAFFPESDRSLILKLIRTLISEGYYKITAMGGVSKI